MRLLLLTALAILFAGVAAATTTIYLSDGTAIDTDDNVYVSKEPLYTVEGTLADGLEVAPASPLVPSEGDAGDEPELCPEGSFEYFNNPECPGYQEEEEEQVAACFPPLWMEGCEEEEDEPEVCYEIVGTWAIEVPCEG